MFQTTEEMTQDKEETVAQLKKEGMDEDAIDKLLRKHDKELQSLKQAQDEERKSQKANFEVSVTSLCLRKWHYFIFLSTRGPLHEVYIKQ